MWTGWVSCSFLAWNVGLHVGNSTKQYSFIYHLTVHFSQESCFNPFFCLRQQRVYTTVVCMIKKVWKMSFCLFFFFTLQPNMVITLSTKNDSNKTNPNFQLSKRGFSDGINLFITRWFFFCELEANSLFLWTLIETQQKDRK